MPSDMHDQVNGMNAFDMVNEISENMTDFVTMPVGKRTETLGLRNAFRKERNGASRTTAADQGAGSFRQPVGRGVGDADARASGKLDEQPTRGSGSNRAATKLDGPTKQDIPFDDLVAADIAKAKR